MRVATERDETILSSINRSGATDTTIGAAADARVGTIVAANLDCAAPQAPQPFTFCLITAPQFGQMAISTGYSRLS